MVGLGAVSHALHCENRDSSQAAKVSVDELPREAFGVRGACSRFRTAPRLATAPASWTHSKCFAQFGCGLAVRRSPRLGGSFARAPTEQTRPSTAILRNTLR